SMIEAMAPVTRLLVNESLPSATAEGWLWLTPISAQVASYSAPFVVAGIAVVFGMGYFFLKRGAAPARMSSPWDCGFGQLNHRMQYTSTAFSQPIRRVFGATWKVEEQIDRVEDEGPIPRLRGIHHQVHVHDWSWLVCYVPIGKFVLAAARRIGFIQTGNIHTYLKYSFATLLVFLWIVS
ncbi:MAG TPA: hypothetical protein VFV55_09085, partial [Usitatibacteraceae bacterium]|nr:hypothetical protein [Usitatibacteraceae bacterium]